jgi:hypothetical protein
MPDSAESHQVSTNTSVRSYPNLSKYDELAIQVLKSNPDFTREQIGKELVRLGVSKSKKTIHTRWFRNDYLRRELTEVRNHNLQEIQRKLVPKSLIKLRKQLGNSDDKIQMAAINTTLKYGMGEMVNAPPQQVNLIQIQQAAIGISADISRITDQD